MSNQQADPFEEFILKLNRIYFRPYQLLSTFHLPIGMYLLQRFLWTEQTPSSIPIKQVSSWKIFSLNVSWTRWFIASWDTPFTSCVLDRWDPNKIHSAIEKRYVSVRDTFSEDGGLMVARAALCLPILINAGLTRSCTFYITNAQSWKNIEMVLCVRCGDLGYKMVNILK